MQCTSHDKERLMRGIRPSRTVARLRGIADLHQSRAFARGEGGEGRVYKSRLWQSCANVQPDLFGIFLCIAGVRLAPFSSQHKLAYKPLDGFELQPHRESR